MDNFFTISSPTFEKYLEDMQRHQAELLGTQLAMEILLAAEREDVDKQFDEKQGSWTQLAPYTVKKKEEANSDPRTLHETRSGSGLRLRDAYKQTGYVDSNGDLVFNYPVEKPYAQDHQEGLVSNSETPIQSSTKRKRKSMAEQRSDKLDREYQDRFFK